MDGPPAICTLAILLITGATSFQGFRNPAFQERFIFDPAAILRDKEYFRLVTSGFLHVDWIHFAFNAFSFYSFARLIEFVFGIPTLLLIYFGSIIGGSLLSLYIHRHHEYRALGASGGICGVIFASIFLLPGGGIMMFPLPVPIPTWLYAVLFIVGSFIAMKRQIGNIGHDAHLGGAIVGLLVATALHPSIVPASPKLYFGVMGLSAAMLAYLWLNPMLLPASSFLGRWHDFLSETRWRWTKSTQAREDKEMDRLLEKIASSGIHSLSLLERKRLDLLAERRRNRAGARQRHA